MAQYVVAALYKFTAFDDPSALIAGVRAAGCSAGVRGTLLFAPEGLNGTIAGSRSGINQILRHLRGLPGCSDLEHKESTASEMPFLRLRVRLKREIVTMGLPDVSPIKAVGEYVDPCDWNRLISADDVAVIDTRNDYEVGIGTFDGAIDPQTASFGEFPDWWRANRERFEGKRIAMFCTGGIRCEKATSFLKAEGIEDVYHLRGGILKYLEEVPEAESLWQGECFVFDQRVAVTHGLKEGSHDICYGCRRPLSAADKLSDAYERGVTCPHCIKATKTAQKQRFRERQRQVDLARARGKLHIGS